MGTPSVGQSRVAFGLFEANLLSGELYRNGRRVALQEKPFRILALLLKRPGEVVTREQVCKELWPEGTFVDFDEGLDTALRKLRYALGDSAQNPIFIETIPRRGYRFIAPVSNGVLHVPPLTTTDESRSPAWPGPHTTAAPARKFFPALVVSAVLLVVAYGVYRWKSRTGALDLRRVQMTKLTDNGQVQGVAISRDGRDLIYTRGDENTQSLWFRDSFTRPDVQILPTGTGFHGLTFSPDGTSIYFVRSDQNDPYFKYLYSMAVRDGPVRKLITDADSPVSFSPDGKQFVYEHCAQPRDEIDVKIANVDGSNDHLLAVIHGASGMFYQPGPNWSPDGRTIALPAVMANSGRWVLDVISVANGNIRELYSTREDLGRPVWLAGGTALMFPHHDKATQRFQLWTISFPQGHAQPITHDLSDYGTDLDMSRDGHTFVSTARTITSHVWIASASDLSRIQQVTSDTLPLVQIAETPDGKLLARSQDSVVWMMHTDGSNRTRFTDLQPDELTSCGNFVVLRVRQSDSMELVRLDKDGSHPVVLVRGNVAPPQCSADKGSIFYLTLDQPQKIWKVPITGGPSQYVADVLGDQLASLLAVSPDRRLLAYAYTDYGRVPSRGWRVAVIPADGGSPVRQFAVPGDMYELHWSPGGKSLQYLLTQNGVTNLWEKPLAGGKPKQLTRFTAGQIFSFNWSSDRMWLLLTRGGESTDAVLLSDIR
jgi:DNA-binding winged helix-turn-helix (wHTH) protein/Tol biopolymer transport system component